MVEYFASKIDDYTHFLRKNDRYTQIDSNKSIQIPRHPLFTNNLLITISKLLVILVSKF